jgi:3-hydroxyisobutyrate dehydrogenase-like beta-hydroxyacid dehydrogenase
MTTVAVVGLGVMGSRIAVRLLDAGHHLVVWNRSPNKMQPLLERGADPAANPAAAAQRAEVLITMLSDPAALRAVSDSNGGIAAGAHAALTVIEMSTIGPEAIAELAVTLPQGTRLIDAPVLGGIGEVDAGALVIFAGGRTAHIDAVLPVLAHLGSVVRVGPLGSGAAAKLVANAILLTNIAAVGEAIALARGLGLTDQTIYDVLATTPLAAQAERRRPQIAAGDYPRRFGLPLARKDAELIRTAARKGRLDLRLFEATRTWLADAQAAGWGEHDYTAMLGRILDRR